jgi:membrane protein YdbS with pleckstrin-like domain
MRDEVRAELRPHGVVLAGPLVGSGLLGIAGAALVFAGWPFSLAGAAALTVAAVSALRAVWRWERTRILVTDERLVVLEGTLRRREAAVSLASVGAVEIEQSLLGRILGYGTVVVGELEIRHVPSPRDLLPQA